MATVWDCQTPKEAWNLVQHWMDSLVPQISRKAAWLGRVTTDGERDRIEGEISYIRAALIGYLHVISVRINLLGLESDAALINAIIEILISRDVSKDGVVDAVYATYRQILSTRT